MKSEIGVHNTNPPIQITHLGELPVLVSYNNDVYRK